MTYLDGEHLRASGYFVVMEVVNQSERHGCKRRLIVRAESWLAFLQDLEKNVVDAQRQTKLDRYFTREVNRSQREHAYKNLLEANKEKVGEASLHLSKSILDFNEKRSKQDMNAESFHHYIDTHIKWLETIEGEWVR